VNAPAAPLAKRSSRRLSPPSLRLLWLNAVGGAAVLASYAWGLGALSAAEPGLWGGVPAAWRPAYTLNMLLAAVGYFAFTSYWVLAVAPERVRFAGGGFVALTALYAAILFPSALWLPLTALSLDDPASWVWLAIRIDLAVVAVGSLGVLGALLTLEKPPAPRWRLLAIAGCAPFVLQTAVLDAILWPWLYPR
jgi:hypothetical protein